MGDNIIMDSNFISNLSDDQLTRITPTIFDTLQGIIQGQHRKLDGYSKLCMQPGISIPVKYAIFYLEAFQVMEGTGAIVIETDGYDGHLFHNVMPEDIEKLLGIPLTQCRLYKRADGDDAIICFDPPNNTLFWEIAILINNDRNKDILKKYGINF